MHEIERERDVAEIAERRSTEETTEWGKLLIRQDNEDAGPDKPSAAVGQALGPKVEGIGPGVEGFGCMPV